MTNFKQSVIFAAVLSIAYSSACSQSPQAVEKIASPAATEPAQPAQPASDENRKIHDGPFGLVGGLKLNEVEKLIPDLKHDEGTFHISKTMPEPHTSFEFYTLQFSEKSGLCSIIAIGRNINSGGTGSEVRMAFGELDDALTEKYGKGKDYDFATGIMDDPQYWMIALSSKDRTLAKLWKKGAKASLPPGMSSVFIQAHASDMRTGYVNLKYEFSNFDDCESEQKSSKNKAL